MKTLRSLAAVGMCAAAAAAAFAGDCDGKIGSYQGHLVRKVKVTSPVGFFLAAKFGLDRIARDLPQQANAPFDLGKFNQGVSEITTAVRTLLPDGFTSMRFVAAVGNLEACENGTLEVHYTVYTAIVPPLSGRSFEAQQAETERPATTGASLGTTGRFQVVPNFGYDRARRGYGGMQFRSAMPFHALDQFEMDTSASSSSLLGDLSLSGRSAPAMHYLNEAQWRLDSIYSDLPAGPQRLKEAKVAGSLFGSSKQLAGDRLVLRYGFAIAGGHQQSTASVTPNSSYGDLKFVVDGTGRLGSAALMGAYGLQLGSTFAGHGVDFVKQVVDLGYTTTLTPLPKFVTHKGSSDDDRAAFIGEPHHPFSLESRFTGGVIQTIGDVPAAERFYGGNQSVPFIEGQPFDMRSQAFIRSIPDNRLGSSFLGLGSGGTRFYSLNLTIARAIFGRAILPKELGTADFVHNLDFGINTAKGELADTYLGRDPTVKAGTTAAGAIQSQVARLKSQVAQFAFDAALTAQLAPILKDVNSDINRVSRTVDNILKGGANTASPLFNTILPRLEQNLSKIHNVLAAAGQSGAAGQIDQRRAELETARAALRDDLSGPNIEAARKRAGAQADRDFSMAEKVLNTFLYQLNVYSISPVAIFDVARVWPAGTSTHYAAGGGVRLSLVNVNFTLGYAANPVRRAGEGAGALFFNLDVSDLFH